MIQTDNNRDIEMRIDSTKIEGKSLLNIGAQFGIRIDITNIE